MLDAGSARWLCRPASSRVIAEAPQLSLLFVPSPSLRDPRAGFASYLRGLLDVSLVLTLSISVSPCVGVLPALVALLWAGGRDAPYMAHSTFRNEAREASGNSDQLSPVSGLNRRNLRPVSGQLCRCWASLDQSCARFRPKPAKIGALSADSLRFCRIERVRVWKAGASTEQRHKPTDSGRAAKHATTICQTHVRNEASPRKCAQKHAKRKASKREVPCLVLERKWALPAETRRSLAKVGSKFGQFRPDFHQHFAEVGQS